MMDLTPEMAMKAIEALEAGDATVALELLKELLIKAAAGGDVVDEVTPPPDEGTDAGTDTTALAGDEDDEERQALSQTVVDENSALAQALMRMTGCSTAGLAVEHMKKLHSQVQVLNANAAAIELSERRGLIANLVQLSVEVPALAWEGEPDKRIPCKRLAQEPIGDLRARVKALSALRPAGSGVRPPVTNVQDGMSENEKIAFQSLSSDPAAQGRFTTRIAQKQLDRKARLQ